MALFLESLRQSEKLSEIKPSLVYTVNSDLLSVFLRLDHHPFSTVKRVPHTFNIFDFFENLPSFRNFGFLSWAIFFIFFYYFFLLTKKEKKSDFVEIVPVKDKFLSRSELCDDNVVKKETGYFLHRLSNNIRNMSIQTKDLYQV